MCFLNQKGGLSSARAAQANKQKPVNGKLGAAGRSQTTKREPLSVPAGPEGGTAFEATNRLNRTFHLRDAGDGRSGCLQPPQNLIKASCRREEAHSCSPTAPHPRHGASQGFLKTTGPPSQGPVGKPRTDALCSQTSEHCGPGESKPLSGPEKKRKGSKAHRKCKDHPPDERPPFGNK